jgi:hypothetical protein
MKSRIRLKTFRGRVLDDSVLKNGGGKWVQQPFEVLMFARKKVLKERLGETSRDFKTCPRWVGDSSAEIYFVKILSEKMRGSMIADELISQRTLTIDSPGPKLNPKWWV